MSLAFTSIASNMIDSNCFFISIVGTGNPLCAELKGLGLLLLRGCPRLERRCGCPFSLVLGLLRYVSWNLKWQTLAQGGVCGTENILTNMWDTTLSPTKDGPAHNYRISSPCCLSRV